MPEPISSDKNEYELMQKFYNCDLNYPGELFPPTPVFMIDKTAMTFQQRLEEIVNRRDNEMTRMIDGLLKEASPDKRYFFAVGFCKRKYLSIHWTDSLFFLLSSFNGFK